jgi:hypothetical protein
MSSSNVASWIRTVEPAPIDTNSSLGRVSPEYESLKLGKVKVMQKEERQWIAGMDRRVLRERVWRRLR